MTITKTISSRTAIQRLKRFCKDNNYTITSQDPEAIEFTDHILTCTNVAQEPADRYTVYGFYSSADMIKAEGSLIEMMYDFDLLEDNEILLCEMIMLPNNNILNRRNQVRRPWFRSAN